MKKPEGSLEEIRALEMPNDNFRLNAFGLDDDLYLDIQDAIDRESL